MKMTVSTSMTSMAQMAVGLCRESKLLASYCIHYLVIVLSTKFEATCVYLQDKSILWRLDRIPEFRTYVVTTDKTRHLLLAGISYGILQKGLDKRCMQRYII
jgi:hypothetical protein